jgi:hypothetical protein
MKKLLLIFIKEIIWIYCSRILKLSHLIEQFKWVNKKEDLNQFK